MIRTRTKTQSVFLLAMHWVIEFLLLLAWWRDADGFTPEEQALHALEQLITGARG